MIVNIEMINFKAHESLVVKDIPKIAVIVGRNNTGKSSILHAAVLDKYRQPQESVELPMGSTKRIPFKGQVPIVIISYKYNQWRADYRFTVQKNSNHFYLESPSSDKKINHIKEVFYISSVRYVDTTYQYRDLGQDVGSSGENTNSILQKLKTDDDPRFTIILDWLSKMNLGITLVATPPTPNPNFGEIKPTSYNSKTNIMMHGSGTWALLPIITQGVLCQKGHTLLIEEPETHLHRAAIDELWRFFGDCAERGVQVICTTHSIDFLASMSQRIEKKDIPEDSMIYLLKRDTSGKTSIEKKDPTLFSNIAASIRASIKSELAGLDS